MVSPDVTGRTGAEQSCCLAHPRPGEVSFKQCPTLFVCVCERAQWLFCVMSNLGTKGLKKRLFLYAGPAEARAQLQGGPEKPPWHKQP